MKDTVGAMRAHESSIRGGKMAQAFSKGPSYRNEGAPSKGAYHCCGVLVRGTDYPVGPTQEFPPATKAQFKEARKRLKWKKMVILSAFREAGLEAVERGRR